MEVTHWHRAVRGPNGSRAGDGAPLSTGRSATDGCHLQARMSASCDGHASTRHHRVDGDVSTDVRPSTRRLSTAPKVEG